jgi:hypothetical protein
MSKTISMLIGAGFSAPMGYPIGNQLNNYLVKCTGDEFSFHTDGTLITSIDGSKPNLGFKTSYDIQFEFCKALINYYNTVKNGFDYEEFYDFMLEEAENDNKVKQLAQPYLNNYSSLKSLLLSIDNIYAQIISYYLKDKDGNSWYDNASHACRPIFQGYTGILNCFQSLLRGNVIHIHSLNHDLFFERLNNSDWIAGEICDGFEELGSPYYGKLYSHGREYRVRLEAYTGRYNKKICLYKLHGSKDYGVYYTMKSNGIAVPECYIKTRFGVPFGGFLKERKTENVNLEYEHCFVNYHADFLTGTTSKIERYKEPLLYKMLFELFRNNLRTSEKLIIIGYGAKDTEINKMILENFNYIDKPTIIIDPYPNDSVIALKNAISAKLVDKHLENVENDDISMR